MGTRDARVDAYVARSADFARPILMHLREVVHAACPDVEETIKWGFPHFMYNGLLCSMAGFKQHCAFTLWKGAVILEDDTRSGEAMGQFGRITALSDLPPDGVLAGYVREAMRLNEAPVKQPGRSRPGAKPEIAVPDHLVAALSENDRAQTTWDNFSPSHKREYVEWITEAKGEATRKRRLDTAMEWIAEGKPRNWKYVK